MYRTEVAALSRYGLSSARGLADVITFALLSARQHFSVVPRQMDEVREQGERSKALWGWKRDGYRFLQGEWANATVNYLNTLLPRHSTAALGALLSVPGLGLVKGGFVAQMLGFEVGCIDSRNAARLGLPLRAWDFNKHRLRPCSHWGQRRKIITGYVGACATLGGAEYLWDSWCDDYAAQNGMTGETVSKMHLAAIAPGATIRRSDNATQVAA